ncbi:hypothetical protein C2S53_020237 [Perilla frutescens var. hirtella]|uniref:Uncharacterized protein n=1 Tax=Perilla frutescens var. hirtella TaxID=608512 RepID=A0AAD4P6R3_PERFH|nr:hypothetical protein C2S53_020237 [Perilla frutescens var. hirtella]
MTRGGGSHGTRSRAISSMGSVGGPIDDSVGQDGTDTQVEESRTVDSRRELELETVGRERIMRPSNQFSRELQLSSRGTCILRASLGRRRSIGGLILMRRCFRCSRRSARTGSSSQTHHGGARSAVDHMHDLAREQHLFEWEARYQTYLRLHCLDGLLWTSAKARENKEKCNALAAEWIADGRDPDMGEIYRQVVAPDRKGRAIRLGNMAHAVRRHTTAVGGSSSSASLGSGSLYTQAELDTRLAEIQSQMQTQMEEKLSVQQATVQQVLDKQARMESLLEHLLSQQPGDARGSGGSGSGSGRQDDGSEE